MSIIKTCKLFTVLKKLNVEVIEYNNNYFNEERELINIHSLLLSDFINSEFDDLIEFFKDSVENNYYLNDMLLERDFEIKNDTINFKEDNEEYSYINMGCYAFDNKKIYISGSYSFVEDLIEEKKYIYYGD